MKFSIVIVTYNAEEYIKNCIDSLYQDAFDINSFEIIIVDSNSTDKTKNIINNIITTKPKIKCFYQDINVGFSKGCNIGASKVETNLILFLNPDTLSKTKNWDKILIEKHIPNAITGFNFFFGDGSPQFPIGKFPFKISRIICDKLPYLRKRFGVLVRDEKFYNIKRKVDWVCGCGLIIPKKIFDELKGFDENIFMYWDETDLCYRAKQKGYECYYIPDILFYHEKDGHSKNRSEKRKLYIRKNLKYILKKNSFYSTLFFFELILMFEKLIETPKIISSFFKKEPNI